MRPILEIRSVGKRYRINHQSVPYLSLREWLGGLFRSTGSREDFWALRDVSFDVHPGECVGIIGRNGAGKSTLLKVLSRITPPTAGHIVARGRIASLLEVGTGFHPELTGRENIFLNGSILGMRRNEILAKFDQIIDFAGTEKFLDTPLKHYSNGMQLRLAFSVAAFLEPEILIIDEVLAVGDSEFQKKCLGKMQEVSSSGRTILFVSHNMTAITNLCARAVLLQEGRVRALGPASDMIEAYRSMIEQDAGASEGLIRFDHETRWKAVRQVELLCDGKRSSTAGMGASVEIRVYFDAPEPLDQPLLGIIIKDNQNTPIIGVNNRNYGKQLVTRPVKTGCVSMRIPQLILFEGMYSIDIHFGNRFSDLDVIRDLVQLTVEANSRLELPEMPSRRLNRVFVRDIDWEYSSKPKA